MTLAQDYKLEIEQILTLQPKDEHNPDLAAFRLGGDQ